MALPTDGELLEQWRAGDAASGQSLFSRYFDSVYRFFDTKCAGEADELVQSTFFACLRAKDSFRGDASFRTYLFTIARHELHRVLREHRRDERLDFDVSSVLELVSTPATKIGRNQEHQRVVEVLRQLPVESQTLLELYYWEDLEVGALAEIFDAPAVTIRSRLHRARGQLRELMAKDAKLAGEDPEAWARRNRA